MSETVAGLLARGSATLRAAGIDTPERDGRALLARVLNLPAGRMTLHLRDPVDDADAQLFADFVADRTARIPVSRILGQRAFFGRDFRINGDVLDPRPETETLVIQALAVPFKRLLDLGTGSGCILVSLLAERPAATGTGTDIDDATLATASTNADLHGVGDRATFLRSDWFAAIDGRYDLIVSNPPYIAEDEMPALAPEVRDHDPHVALTPGGDGLAAYRTIAEDALHRLLPGGRLLVEIGPTQGAAVRALFQAAGLCETAVYPDLDGRDRVVRAKAPMDRDGINPPT